MMDKKEFYEKRAGRYTNFDKQGYLRYVRALELVKIESGDKILDIGCKHACLCDILTKREMHCDYYGIDISDKVINHVKDKRGVFKVCDVMNELPFEKEQFDYVFCLELLEHVENPTFLLREIHRIITKKGALLLSVPNPYNWASIFANIMKLSGREGHIHSFTFRDLETLLKFTGFSIKKRIGTYTLLPYTRHGIKEGRYFMFRSDFFLLTTSYIYQINKCANSD